MTCRQTDQNTTSTSWTFVCISTERSVAWRSSQRKQTVKHYDTFDIDVIRDTRVRVYITGAVGGVAQW